MPDHSTFSKNRHGRFAESDLFRHLFEEVVARCFTEGLVGGERAINTPAFGSQSLADVTSVLRAKLADKSVSLAPLAECQ